MKTIKIFLLFLIFIVFNGGLLVAENIQTLVILPNHYGANSFFIMEMLSEFGWEPTYTAVSSTVNHCFWGQPITVDTIISDLESIDQYECVIICPARWYTNPSNAYNDLLNSQETMDLLVEANDAGKVIYATCAGVRVLAAAGILQGVDVTGLSYYEDEYIAAGANYLGPDIPAVIDGNIVTSTRGQIYWKQNSEAIMTALQLMEQDERREEK